GKCKAGPPPLGLQSLTPYEAASAEVPQVLQAFDASEPDCGRLRSHLEEGDGGGKGRCSRLNHHNPLPPQLAEKQGSEELSVIHVQPFCRRNQRAVITRSRIENCGEKEINVETGELTRVQSEFARFLHQPRLPSRLDQVMTNIGGISDEQRAPLGAEFGLPVITKND